MCSIEEAWAGQTFDNKPVISQSDIHNSYEEEYGEPLPTSDTLKGVQLEASKLKGVQDLIDEYMEKNKGLKELEEELEENKDKITPGLHGES